MRKSIKLLYSVVKSTSNLDQIQTVAIFVLTQWYEEKELTGKQIRNFAVWLVRKDISIRKKCSHKNVLWKLIRCLLCTTWELNSKFSTNFLPWRKIVRTIIKLNAYIVVWEKNNFFVFLVWYKNSWKGLCILLSFKSRKLMVIRVKNICDGKVRSYTVCTRTFRLNTGSLWRRWWNGFVVGVVREHRLNILSWVGTFLN